MKTNVTFPAGVEGNRTLLSLACLRMSHVAKIAAAADEHRKEIKLLAKRAGISTLPWSVRRAING